MYDNSTPIGNKVSSGIGALIAAINNFPQEWALTPCIGKRNLWPNWNKTKLARARLIEAVRSQTNHEGKKTLWTGLSIVTGPLSGGVMAIDFDGPAAWKKYLELSDNQAPPFTLHWSSGKPGHFQILLSVPRQKWEGLKPQKIELENGNKLELRWNQCSTLPPSVHPDTQKPYFWESDADTPIAECPDFILDLMREAPPIELPQKPKPENPISTDASEKSLVDILESEILPRLDAEEFYGSYIKLKTSGKNFVGLCPFHDEKTGSLTIAPVKKAFHCFGCGAGGGPVQFIYQLRGGSGSPTGKDFYSVVMELADHVGVKIGDRKNDTSNPNISLTPHPRTREYVVCQKYDSAESGYIPDTAPVAELNFVQKAEAALYTDTHWVSVGGQLHRFVGTHYELRSEAEEKRRIGNWLNTYSEKVKDRYVYNRAKSSNVMEVLNWVVNRTAIDPSKINPGGLNCSNGVVRINPDGTHTFSPHNPELVYTYVGCKYYPDIDPKDCDRLLECLEPLHREIFLRTAAASLDLKLVRKRRGRDVKGLLCQGDGNNGKDSLREALAAVLGQGMTGKTLSDFKSYDTGRKFTLAGIEESLCNWSSENTSAVNIDSLQSLKQLITGDPLDIERKGKDSFPCKPNAIFFANCNKMPAITGGMEAITSRYSILKFEKTFTSGAKASEGQLEADSRFKYDPEFMLNQVAPAMLNKMLELFPLILKEGIDHSVTEAAMQEAQEESRHLWGFVREMGIEAQPGGRIYIKDLWEKLREWYQDNGTLEIEYNKDYKEKPIWNDLSNRYDTPVKAVNQVYARFCEIFPKIQKHKYNERADVTRKGQWYISGIALKQNSPTIEQTAPPSSPACTVSFSASPTASPTASPRRSGEAVGEAITGSGEASGEAVTYSQSRGEAGEAVSLTAGEILRLVSQMSELERQRLSELTEAVAKVKAAKTWADVQQVIGDDAELREQVKTALTKEENARIGKLKMTAIKTVGTRVRYVGTKCADQYAGLELVVDNFDQYRKISCLMPDGSFTTWLDPKDLEVAD